MGHLSTPNFKQTQVLESFALSFILLFFKNLHLVNTFVVQTVVRISWVSADTIITVATLLLFHWLLSKSHYNQICENLTLHVFLNS